MASKHSDKPDWLKTGNKAAEHQSDIAPLPTSNQRSGPQLKAFEPKNTEIKGPPPLPSHIPEKEAEKSEASNKPKTGRKGPDKTELGNPPARTIKAKKKRLKKRKRSLKPLNETVEKAANSFKQRPGPIVAKGTIAGHSLVLVIAIMSFLAALTVAAVSVIADATRDWQSDIGKGATIQIRQIDDVDIEAELAKAIAIANQTRGISRARVLSSSQSNNLLEPWLGLDISFDSLPIPRLIELTIDNPAEVDFETLSKQLQNQVQGAIVDNHRFWVARLRSMAETAIMIGVIILLLVLSATILTVVFATRSAMSGNKETIEVLHFVGASNGFIAGEFQRKFFSLGFTGSLAGGCAAILTFLLLQVVIRQDKSSATFEQMQALLGVVKLGQMAYFGTMALIILTAIFTAITTRLTVLKTLNKLH